MAHHKSALKRIRQNIKKTARNRSLKSDVRTVIKKFRVLVESKDIENQSITLDNIENSRHQNLHDKKSQHQDFDILFTTRKISY